MKPASSLQQRLGVWLGVLLTVTWIVAAAVTALVARHEIDKVFDSALQETAQRILPLAVADVLARDALDVTQKLAEIREHDELITYIVRDARGQILLQSHDADPALFPDWVDVGFERSATHLFYSEQALQGSIRITVAESLAHRDLVAREMQMALGLPVLIMLPIALLAIFLIVRTSLAPLRRFRDRLVKRDERDMSLIPARDLPVELAPLAASLNDLLARLGSAFEAERSFTSNAAHELRTPLAGAIAQVQRLRAETRDPGVHSRCAELERTLKRMTRLSESLLQLARAQASRVRVDQALDMVPVLRLLTDDFQRIHAEGRIQLKVPDTPLLSDMDPDIFAIMCRNLLENAIRHGDSHGMIVVTLSDTGLLTVANEGDVVPPERLSRLTRRFERGQSLSQGTGLGLAIVSAIALRIGSGVRLLSPRSGSSSGFEAVVQIPMPHTSGRRVAGAEATRADDA